jgi:4-hydroxy-2-oxoheptanedioate aldolase
MKSAALLKQKINGTRPVLGVISTFHFWPGLVELVMNAGMDYLIIDFEHLSHNAEMVAEACAIGRRSDFPILIRPSSADFSVVRLAMDLGPCGLLVPYVQGPDTMHEIRDAVYMKPRGRRRPGGLGEFFQRNQTHGPSRQYLKRFKFFLPLGAPAV